MKKNLMYLLILLICLFGLVLLPTSAQAIPLTFTIDKVLTGDGYTGGWDFGTVTIDDSEWWVSPGANPWVDIKVDLNESSDYINSESHLKVIALNFAGDVPEDAYFHSFYDSILYDRDEVKAGGFKSYFDLRIPDSGELHATDKYSNVIGLAYDAHSRIDIDPEDFAWETGGGYMAFHIGGLETDIDGSDSVWAGANLPNLPNPVPEPSTMLLLGVGLIGLAGIGRKKFVKK